MRTGSREPYGASMHTVGYNSFYTLDEARRQAARLHLECRAAVLGLETRRNRRTAGRERQLLVSHDTLLRLCGMTATMDTVPAYDSNAIHLTTCDRRNLRRAEGFQFHHWSQDCEVRSVDDVISGVSPMQAICQMAQYTGLRSLIIAMDWMTCANPDLRICTRNELEDYVSSIGRFTGAATCRRALRRSKPGTDSPQETVLRCECDDYGLPPSEVNYEIYDHIGGTTLRVDIAFPREHVVIEYDGRYHYTMDRWEFDLAKRNRLRALGYQPFVATQATLATRDSLNEFLRMVGSAIMEYRLNGSFS